MATVYSALGSKIDIVEMLDVLMAGADRDLERFGKNRMPGVLRIFSLKPALRRPRQSQPELKLRLRVSRRPLHLKITI